METNSDILFNWHSQNGSGDEVRWDYAGNGTSVYNYLSSSYSLSVISGQRKVKQTKIYVPFRPGNSCVITMCGILVDVIVDNLISRIGLFDDHSDKLSPSGNDIGGDGHFFQLIGSQLSVVQRNSIIDSPYQTDVVINQTNWNLDKLDGTGASGFILDPTKTNIYAIKKNYQGVGNVLFGIKYKDNFIWAHEITNENILTTTYMKRDVLPVRFEIDASNATSSGSILTQINAAIFYNNPYSLMGRKFSISNCFNRKLVDTYLTPILSIRLNNRNIRGIIDILDINCICESSNNSLISIVSNGSLTDASWSNVNSSSYVDYDTSSTNISNGTILYSFYLSGSNSSKLSMTSDTTNIAYLTSFINGTSDVLSICAQLSADSANVCATINYQELE